MKKNPGWFLIKSAIQIIIPVLSFITHAFEVEKKNPTNRVGYTFLWFGYLSHIKDSSLIVEAIVDGYRAVNTLKNRKNDDELNYHDTGMEIEEQIFIKYPGYEDDLDIDPQFSSPILLVHTRAQTTMDIFRNFNMHLMITANLLYWITNFTGLNEDNNTDDVLNIILKVANHSLDGLIMSLTYLISNTPLITQGSFSQRFIKEFMLPASLFFVYNFGFYLPYQSCGGTGLDGKPLYYELDWDNRPVSTAVLSAVLPLTMPLVNTAILLSLRKLQSIIHSSQGLSCKVQVFKNKASHCMYRILNCIPCRNPSINSTGPRLEVF